MLIPTEGIFKNDLMQLTDWLPLRNGIHHSYHHPCQVTILLTSTTAPNYNKLPDFKLNTSHGKHFF